MSGQFSCESLSPLFNPKSIAVIGASGRKGRPGYDTLLTATALGWKGKIYPVTPNYQEICGWRCTADLADIHETVDLAIIAGSAARIEKDLEQAIDCGARSVLVYGNPRITGEDGLEQRLVEMTSSAGIPMLGPNSIGYVNYSQKTAGSWVPPTVYPAGSVAGIIQSGSFFGGSTLIDPRIRYAITIHPGQESGISMGDMINYALALPETRVIALYLEIIYDPESFLHGLESAYRSGIPVVVLKPGRSESSLSAVTTHTGRMAARDDVIDAVLRKHHVIRVENTDQWLTTLCLLSHVHSIGPGGLSLTGDSGGMRALIIDEATRLGVPLTRLDRESSKQLATILAPDLEPENPVDYWGGEENIAGHVQSCMEIISKDSGTAVAVGLGEFGSVESDAFTNSVADGIMASAESSPVPIVAASYSSRQFNSDRINEFHRRGIPVLDGISTMLRAFGHAFRFRDRPSCLDEFRRTDSVAGEEINLALEKLHDNDECGALELLALAGISVLPCLKVNDPPGLESVVSILDSEEFWPVALKTAEGYAHKSEKGGVLLNIVNEDQLRQAYRTLSDSLGYQALVQPMAPQGVEIALGIHNDSEFGPLIMIASGGIRVELSRDKRFTLCPVGDLEIDQMISNLEVAPLIDGYRGQPPLDRDALAATIVSLSALAWATRDRIQSIDINPVILHPEGAVAVDAVIEKMAK